MPSNLMRAKIGMRSKPTTTKIAASKLGKSHAKRMTLTSARKAKQSSNRRAK